MAITMAITGRQEVREALGFSRNYGSRTLAIAVAMCCVPATGTALAGGGVLRSHRRGSLLLRHDHAQFKACRYETVG